MSLQNVAEEVMYCCW